MGPFEILSEGLHIKVVVSCGFCDLKGSEFAIVGVKTVWLIDLSNWLTLSKSITLNTLILQTL